MKLTREIALNVLYAALKADAKTPSGLKSALANHSPSYAPVFLDATLLDVAGVLTIGDLLDLAEATE